MLVSMINKLAYIGRFSSSKFIIQLSSSLTFSEFINSLSARDIFGYQISIAKSVSCCCLSSIDLESDLSKLLIFFIALLIVVSDPIEGFSNMAFVKRKLE